MWFLQGGGFWPTSLQAWLQVVLVYLVALFTMLVGVWKFLTRPIHKRIDEERQERVRSIEDEREERLREVSRTWEKIAEAEVHRAEKGREMRERIAEVATEAHTQRGMLELTERFKDRSAQDHSTMREHLGRLDAQLTTVMEMMRAMEMDRLHELNELNERLVRIETKLDTQIRKTTPRREGS